MFIAQCILKDERRRQSVYAHPTVYASRRKLTSERVYSSHSVYSKTREDVRACMLIPLCMRADES